MEEREARESLQVMIGHPASLPYFALMRRMCDGCDRVGDYVTVR
jgi:hypothetical protein